MWLTFAPILLTISPAVFVNLQHSRQTSAHHPDVLPASPFTPITAGSCAASKGGSHYRKHGRHTTPLEHMQVDGIILVSTAGCGHAACAPLGEGGPVDAAAAAAAGELRRRREARPRLPRPLRRRLLLAHRRRRRACGQRSGSRTAPDADFLTQG